MSISFLFTYVASYTLMSMLGMWAAFFGVCIPISYFIEFFFTLYRKAVDPEKNIDKQVFEGKLEYASTDIY